ncbi:MAG: hypothetical protein ACK4K7_06515 [Allosphingosinicella sp.]|uniref:hypothetical protein n=1 Tax=Allosphingosinicella sp. TaxID=2823234 RepID=UPI00395CE5C0
MPIFLVACATTPSTPITSDQLVLNLADTPEARPDIFLTARLSGRLVSNGTCIVVRTRSAEVTPLWPVGTRLQSNGTTAEIILPDDRGRVKIGDHVVLSGGGGFSEYASRVGGNAGLCSSTHFSVATAK